jgi:protein-tyrosine phosphatase
MGANRVIGNLWQGSAPPESDELCNDFDCLVLCAIEYQYPTKFPGMELEKIPLHDDGVHILSLEEKKNTLQLAKRVCDWIQNEKRVLVTCAQGLNRSGLVVGLTMLFHDVPLDKTIQMIRKARGEHALSNSDFVDFLTVVSGHVNKFKTNST